MSSGFKKTKMAVQQAEKRVRNFEEVSLGYTEQQALEEAGRCLNCKTKPCTTKCPVGINIPAFIEQVRLKNFAKAYEIIRYSSSLPAVCGRVCPQELQCESCCVRGVKGESVAIGRLERFVADWKNSNCEPEFNCESFKAKKNGKKVAVVGSGPAGISCAGELAKFGFEVCIFEALHEPGGVLAYGIPEFRLPKKIVEREISTLKRLGVKIKTNVLIGRTLSLADLFNLGFKAVFVGVGAGLPRFLNVPGENLNGIYCANEFLTRINLMNAFKPNSQTPIHRAEKFVVVGGGNVAMDAARSAKRLGAKQVILLYRRGEENMSARIEEITHAKEEGIFFQTFSQPVEFVSDENGFVKKIVCERTVLENGKVDKRLSVLGSGSKFEIEADGVVIAIGTKPHPLVGCGDFGFEVDELGRIVVDESTSETSIAGVYAGGDAVSGSATVILAMAAGKKAAKSIFKKFG